MSVYIPSDMIEEILKRLPVKTLLRFRCVSKPWRSLIDSNHFIKLHLHNSEKTNSNRILVVQGSRLRCVNFDFDFKILETGNTRFDPLLVVSSCNGLVLVVSKCKDLLLWNPATRKLNKLPLDDKKSSRVSYVLESYALGYNSKNDDYEVVRVLRAGDAGVGVVSSPAKVYSLKSNSWKMIEPFQYTLPPEGWGVYLNDALHTVVSRNNFLEKIMAFDLVKENHFEVPKPGLNDVKYGFASVDVMGGFLTLVVPGEMNNSSEIWMMKEYGVKGSWSKLLCFQPPISELFTSLHPLAYSKSGDEVLFNYDKLCLILYHLKKETVEVPRDGRYIIECFETGRPNSGFNAVFCMQSLVSPHSPDSGRVETEKQKQGKKGKGIEKKRSYKNFVMIILSITILISNWLRSS